MQVIFCAYYTSMIYITADRFFTVLLNMKYPIYWDVKKTKFLLFGNAAAAVGVIAGLSIQYSIEPFLFGRIFTMYVHSTLNCVVLLLFVATYSFIFYQYSQSQHLRSAQPTDGQHEGGLCTKLMSSKFYLYFLLLLSFILLCVVPNIYFSFGNSSMNYHTVIILYQVSFLIDALIYIFLNPLVRRELRDVVQSCCGCCCGGGGGGGG